MLGQSCYPDRVGEHSANFCRALDINFLATRPGRGSTDAARGAGWMNPLSRVSVSSHQWHPWSHPAVASVSQTERGGSLAGPGSWRPQMASHREPGTNLSPVMGSVLLRVSRSRTESNGTFRKKTLQGKNQPTVSPWSAHSQPTVSPQSAHGQPTVSPRSAGENCRLDSRP